MVGNGLFELGVLLLGDGDAKGFALELAGPQVIRAMDLGSSNALAHIHAFDDRALADGADGNKRLGALFIARLEGLDLGVKVVHRFFVDHSKVLA